MGITSHTQMHAHKHTDISRDFFFLHGEEKWMDVTGRRRTQWRHMLLASSPPTPPCLPFFSARTQTSWHTLCLWGRIMLSQSRRVFPAHQRWDTTHSAGFPTPPPHHFFISFDQNWKLFNLDSWSFDRDRNVSPSEDLCLSFSFLFVQVRSPN